MERPEEGKENNLLPSRVKQNCLNSEVSRKTMWQGSCELKQRLHFFTIEDVLFILSHCLVTDDPQNDKTA